MLFLGLISISDFSYSQALVKGELVDETGKPIESATIGIPGTTTGVSSNKNGKYELTIPSDQEVLVVFRHLSFEEYKKAINARQGETVELNPKLKRSAFEFGEFEFF